MAMLRNALWTAGATASSRCWSSRCPACRDGTCQSIGTDGGPEAFHHGGGEVPCEPQRKQDQRRAEQIEERVGRAGGRECSAQIGEIRDHDQQRAEDAERIGQGHFLRAFVPSLAHSAWRKHWIA